LHRKQIYNTFYLKNVPKIKKNVKNVKSDKNKKRKKDVFYIYD